MPNLQNNCCSELGFQKFIKIQIQYTGHTPPNTLTHWGRAMHICVGKLTIIGSDNGLSRGRRQAIIWTIAGMLLIGPLGTNFSEISIGIQTFSFKKMHLKMSSGKWRPFCLGFNVLKAVSCTAWNSLIDFLIWEYNIIVTSHARHSISDHSQLHFTQQVAQTTNK